MMPHRRSLLLFCKGLLFIPLYASAQDVTPVSSAARVVTAVRLQDSDVIRLDGAPDEPAWQRTQAVAEFLQRDPDNGALATERTEVRVLYDPERLILSVVLHDTDPDGLLGNQMQRDQSFETDDRFMWTLDTFLDERSGYFFEINPAGAMGDGLVDPSLDGGFGDLGAGINKSWDGIWLARVRRTAGGWTAEVEIPFKTLNFDPNAGAWGINFQRTIRRKNEDVLWSGHARNQGVARMSNAGRLEGVVDISQGVGLDLKPYVVGNVSSAPGRGRPSAVAAGDMGMDAFYNLTPALRANISLNTDFAETEVDQRRVNLTRFPLFFPEKRDFFLEGSSFFDFSRESDEAIVPFFSRRIGLDARGTPQRIDLGAKLTGQLGAFDIGVLHVRTREDEARAGADFSVLRFRRRAFQQSYFGALYTRRSARMVGDVDRHTAGVDFELQTSTFRDNKNVEMSGFYLWTSNPIDTRDSSGYGLRMAYQFTRYQVEGSTAEHRKVSVNGEVSLGGFFSGHRREYTVEVGLRPRRGVALALEAEHNVLDLGEHRFETNVFRALVNTQFSPWISVVNNLQYDSVSRLLGWQVRFRWIRRPGNDLYVVYTHNWRELLNQGPRQFRTLDNRLATKLVYTLRL